MKPTIIGKASIDAPVKPTAIPGVEIKPSVKSIHPTVITPGSVKETPVVLGSPTAMKGVIKESQDQKGNRLQKALPDIDITIIGRAVGLYDIDNVDIPTLGVALQEKYWDLVNKFTVLLENTIVTDSTRHVQRVMDIFQEIIAAPENKSFFSREETMWDLYELRKAEIHQLYDILKRNCAPIRSIHTDLMELHSSYRELELDIKATVALLLYLEHKGGCDLSATQLRKLSLMETIAALQNSGIIRDSAIKGVESLIQKITGTILTKVPEWVEHVTLSLRVSKTKTDVYQFRTELNCIMSKLK